MTIETMMLEKKIQNLRRRLKTPLERVVLNRPENRWMAKDKYAYRCLSGLIEMLPLSWSKELLKTRIYFVRSKGILASTISPAKKSHVVIIYPELLRMMRSASPLNAMAVLAHELGHILLKHEPQKQDTLTAQIEADRFAAKIGLGQELYDVLLDHRYAPFIPERLAALEQIIAPTNT